LFPADYDSSTEVKAADVFAVVCNVQNCIALIFSFSIEKVWKMFFQNVWESL